MVVFSREGKVFIVTGEGQVNLIYNIATNLTSSPALGDLDNDGDLEIVFTSYNTGKVYIIHHDGSDYHQNIPLSFPITKFSAFASPVLIDIDGDHDLEIVVGGRQPQLQPVNNVFCIESDGQLRWQVTGEGMYYSPAFGDFDGDGKDDIYCVMETEPGIAGGSTIISIYNFDGQLLTSNFIVSDPPGSGPTLGEINENGGLDILFDIADDISPIGSSIALVDGMTLTTEFLDRVLAYYYPQPVSDMLPNNPGLEFFLYKYIENPPYDFYAINDFHGNELHSVAFSEIPYVDHHLIGDLDNDIIQDILLISFSPIPGKNSTLNTIQSYTNQLQQENVLFVRSETEKSLTSSIINDFDNDEQIDVTVITASGEVYIYPLNSPYHSNSHHWPEAQRDMFNSKRYDPPALSGELSENTTWSGTVRISGDVTVPANVTLTIEPGTRVIFQHGDDERGGEDATKPELIVRGTLNANGTANNPIELFSYSRWYGIVVEPDARLNLNYCWIDRAINGIEIEPTTEPSFTHQINNCRISRCDYGVYVSSNWVELKNNIIHENHTGVYLFESQFTLNEDTLRSNSDYGIYLSNSSDGEITYCVIDSNSYNETEFQFAGIVLYHSSPGIFANRILDNERNGILLIGESFPPVQESNLIANNGPAVPFDEPAWDKAEILMQDVSSPYMNYGHNDVVDNRQNAGYLMMHSGEPDGLIPVRGNYWDSSGSPASRLYPLMYYDYKDWDETPNTSGPPEQRDPEEQLLVNSLQSEKQGNYSSAKSGQHSGHQSPLPLQQVRGIPDS